MIETILFLSLVLIGYTYIGYPVAVWFLARIKQKKIAKNIIHPEVTIVFSVFNEEMNIKNKINTCMSLNYPKGKVYIIVASDGSTDKTCAILTELMKEHANLKFLEFKSQRGKAACINDAMSEVKTDFVVLTDARQEFNLCAIEQLLANFSDPEIGAVSGELQFKQQDSNSYSKGVDIYWRYEKFIRKNESIFSSSVGVSGAIYAIRTKLYQKIPENCILDDVLIPMNIIKQNFRVVFEEKAIAYDVPSNDIDKEKKRKTRTIAGNYQLIQLDPELLNPFKNRILIQFISHKLLRLLMPLFLLLLLISNLLLVYSHIIYQVMMVGQILFYISPLINKLIPLPKLLALFSQGIAAFINLNYFAVLGFFEFINNKNTHIWK